MKNTYYYFIVVLLFVMNTFGNCINVFSQSVKTNHHIDINTEFINGWDINPGDTIYIEPGQRGPLYFGNIRGSSEQPLIILNMNEKVTIESEIGYGISFSNCQFIKLSGSGSSDEYGIHINNVSSGSGIKAGMLTSDIEITRLEISNTKYTGITAKSDPTCTYQAVRDSFTMYNTHIHNNYIHDIGTEGLYIGNSFYLGVNLEDCDTTVLPHILDGVDIHHNIIENTGWDGIQLGCALYNSQIHHNYIYEDSQEEKVYQMSGIIVNPGSSADVYNNTIINGKGTGISLQTTGGQKVYNNLIINAGQGYIPDNQTTKQKFGIYSKYKINEGNDSSYLFCNNTIINPKSDGIRFHNSHTSIARFYNNIICNPGAYSYYETNGNNSNTGDDSYINIYYDDIIYELQSNLMERSSKNIFFVDTTSNNYNIHSYSPAVDYAFDVSHYGIMTDIEDQTRPFGLAYDIGAYEYSGTSIESKLKLEDEILIFPNPASDYINIKTTKKIKIIEIYSISKNHIKTHYPNSENNKIDCSNLTIGFYNLYITLEDNRIIRKNIIKI